MYRIENITQLRNEISRLEKQKTEQEISLKVQISMLRDAFRPLNLLLSALSSITGIKLKENVFLKDGLFYGFSLLLQRFILRAESNAEETIYHFLDTVVDKIKSFAKQRKSSKAESDEN
jgi:hypothetical protein